MRNQTGGMMLPFMIPTGSTNEPGPSSQGDFVPPRVDKAMEFLASLSQKTAKRPVANDISIEVIDGQALTTEEQSAQATACNLLERYFAGRLPKDDWDRAKLDGPSRKEMRLLRCFMCCMHKDAKPNPNCPMCEGAGTVLVMSPGTSGAAPIAGVEIESSVTSEEAEE